MHLLRLSLASALLVVPLAAQIPMPLDAANPVAAQIFTRSAATGMVIVIVRNGEVWQQSYGQTFPGSHQKPSVDSLLRLCSITKIMTTDLFVKLALVPDRYEHRVALTDPLQKFAPPGSAAPTRTFGVQNSRPITLGDLATHTAGLPREIAYPPGDSAHFTFPDFNFRWQWLPSFTLRSVPGTRAHYSNVGFDLLADALASANGKPYPELFAERTAQPIGLHETTLTPNPEQCARLLRGRKSQGPCTDTTAAAGSGGMYSTPRDMTLWLKYLVGLPGVPMHQPAAATATYLLPSELKSVQGLNLAGNPTGIGLGWIRINGTGEPGTIIEKTGGGAGFQTYLALSPATHSGLFVAITEGRSSAINLFHESNNLLLAISDLPPIADEPGPPATSTRSIKPSVKRKPNRPAQASRKPKHRRS